MNCPTLNEAMSSVRHLTDIDPHTPVWADYAIEQGVSLPMVHRMARVLECDVSHLGPDPDLPDWSSFLRTMVYGYLECLVWTGNYWPDASIDSDPEPLDQYVDVSDLGAKVWRESIGDCASFIRLCLSAGIDLSSHEPSQVKTPQAFADFLIGLARQAE